MSDDERIELFERAFSSRISGCRGTCQCGRVFFDDYNGGIDWEPNEKETLRAQGATPEGGSIGFVRFEGRQYVSTCDCWRDRAFKIMNFVEQHGPEIGAYLNARRESLVAHARTVPEIKA